MMVGNDMNNRKTKQNKTNKQHGFVAVAILPLIGKIIITT